MKVRDLMAVLENLNPDGEVLRYDESRVGDLGTLYQPKNSSRVALVFVDEMDGGVDIELRTYYP